MNPFSGHEMCFVLRELYDAVNTAPSNWICTIDPFTIYVFYAPIERTHVKFFKWMLSVCETVNTNETRLRLTAAKPEKKRINKII